MDARREADARADELSDRLRFVEMRRAAADDENDQLRRALGAARAEVEALRGEEREMHRLEAEQAKWHGERAELRELVEVERRRASAAMATTHEALAERDRQVDALQDNLERALTNGVDNARALEEARARTDELDRTSGDMATHLITLKEQLKYATLARRADAHAQAALAQLQLDNKRLIELLGATAEYSGFVLAAEDSGGLSFIPAQVAARAKAAAATARRERVSESPKHVRSAAKEAERWVPTDAYAVAHHFRQQHAPGVDMDVFAELVATLNRVWLARETRRLERQKAEHAKVTDELRRRVQQKQPYESIVHAKEVGRLKQELRELRKALQKGHQRLNKEEEHLLDASMGSLHQLGEELQLAQAQAERSKRDAADALTRGRGEYMRGARAMAAAAVDQTERLVESVHHLVRELQEQTLSLSRQDAALLPKMLRAQSWFLENLEVRLIECRRFVGGLSEGLPEEGPQDGMTGNLGESAESFGVSSPARKKSEYELY